MANRISINLKGIDNLPFPPSKADKKRFIKETQNEYFSFIEQTNSYLKNYHFYVRIKRGITKVYLIAKVTDAGKMFNQIQSTNLFEYLDLTSRNVKYQPEKNKLVICQSFD